MIMKCTVFLNLAFRSFGGRLRPFRRNLTPFSVGWKNLPVMWKTDRRCIPESNILHGCVSFISLDDRGTDHTRMVPVPELSSNCIEFDF